MDYKESLNLPKTGFPMRAELPKREPLILKEWRESNLYERLMESRKDAPVFILHDGPPFANGDAHMGHALNMTLKDIVLKSKNMAGFCVPFIPGWDCHGLPIEHKVVKEQMGGSASHKDAAKIREKSAAYAKKYVGIQSEQFQRLGVFGDWGNPYLTMSPAYEADILRSFACLVEKGMVEEGQRPVRWSVGCQTALAEAEIEYLDRTDSSIYVKFPVVSGVPASCPTHGKKTHLIVWTTTPWTLPANLAIAVRANMKYVLASCGEEVWILAAALLEAVQKTANQPLSVLCEVTGEDLLPIVYQHPFIGRTGKLLAADFVTDDSGTGLVHIAPGHGPDDYQAGMKAGLEVLSPVDENGCLTEACMTPSVVGKYVFDANPVIVQILKDCGLLVAEEALQHSYPHCWRSKTPIIFRAVKQWFIRVESFRREALEAIDRVNWVPSWGKNRIRGAVETRPDWCISRQRYWGVPIPVFYDEQGKPLMTAELVCKFADIVESEGSNVWYSLPDDVLAAKLGLPSGLQKGLDTLDVWIDSGTSHAAVVRRRLSFPADLYLEGSDQHRGWFQSSLLTSVAMTGEAPYREVLTNGFVVDLDGKKLSKSNAYQKPTDLMHFVNKEGADILRLWVASQDFRDDVPFSEEIFSHVRDTYRAVRNTLRILLGNLNDFKESDAVRQEDFTPPDMFAMHRFAATSAQCLQAYKTYEFHQVYHAINKFCAVDLSSFYVDVLKDRMYCDAVGSAKRRSAQTAMKIILEGLCKLLAPIVPFTAEEAWWAIGHKDSVHMQIFSPVADPGNEQFAALWKSIMEARDLANTELETLRREKKIGRSLDASVVIGEEVTAERDSALLAEVFNVSSVSFRPGKTVSAAPAIGKKCVRCWKIVSEFCGDAEHAEVCPRCLDAVRSVKNAL